MSNDQYLLPSETLALLVFLVGPPLLMALVAQTAVFWRRRAFRRAFLGRLLLAYAGTVVATLVISTVLLAVSWEPLARILSVRDIPIGEAHFPVFPGAVVAAAIAALTVTAGVLLYGRGEG